MKYYSEVTKKLYNTFADLAEAEKAVKKAEAKKNEAEEKKKAERTARAKEVEKALKASNEAQQKAIKMLKEFIHDYGYFHTSYTTDDVDNVKANFFDILDNFLS